MPVFDFTDSSYQKDSFECTYTVFYSDEHAASADHPMMLLDNSLKQWKHHSNDVFTNPSKKTTFEFEEEDGTVSANILSIDARFVSLLK